MINALCRRAIRKREAIPPNQVGGLFWEEYILAVWLLCTLISEVVGIGARK
jgi:hypothetical protein